MTDNTDTLKDTTTNPDLHQRARAEYETPTMVTSKLRLVTLGGPSGINDSGDENNTEPF